MGNVVIINHENGVHSLYAHLSTIEVVNGARVGRGARIGTYGDTGFSAGCPTYDPDHPVNPHLHFELKVWNVLGSLHDDEGGLNRWGYTPMHPNLHGFINPFPYLEFDIRDIEPSIIQTQGSPIRTGPDSSYVQNVGTVSSGAMFVAFAEYNGWYQIHFPSGVGPATGWVRANAARTGQILKVADRVQSQTGVRVRRQPTTNSTEVARVWNDQLLVGVSRSQVGSGCNAMWHKIHLIDGSGASEGWICGEFIETLEEQSPSSECVNLQTAANPVPQGFGAAYNVLSREGELLLSATCEAAGVPVVAGNGSDRQYIYKDGYEWIGGEWRRFTYVGALRAGDWYVRRAAAVLQRTPEQLATSNYFVGYICTWTGSEWKCGCRDAACNQSFWQLQAFRRQ